MTFNDYQKLARRTANLDGSPTVRVVNWTLGLTGEAGEVADLVKKGVFHGHTDITAEDIAEELGDLLWYVANTASELGFSLEDIAAVNIEKLKARYPDGFDSDRSMNRNEGGEG